jgi:hypothetical protein
MRHTSPMTMIDLGPERPGGHASETREWADRGRTAHDHHVSTRRFLIMLAIIVVALVMFFVLR